MQDAVRRGDRPSRPWSLHTNGDLWEHFEAYVKAKGPDGVSFSKVKGHATDDDVHSGKVRICDKVGNDEADQAAAETLAEYGDVVLHFAQRVAQRHETNMRSSLPTSIN